MQVIYNWFNNYNWPDSQLAVVDKANPENLWAQANVKKVDTATKAHLKTHPDAIALAARRIVVCQMFRDLPGEEQTLWKSKAQELKHMKQEAGALDGTARDEYVCFFLLSYSRSYSLLFQIRSRISAGPRENVRDRVQEGRFVVELPDCL